MQHDFLDAPAAVAGQHGSAGISISTEQMMLVHGVCAFVWLDTIGLALWALSAKLQPLAALMSD
jgi:hypothetical protein